MSCISYDNFDRTERYYKVAGKDNLLKKNTNELNISLNDNICQLTTKSEQLKETISEKKVIERNLKDFTKEV